MERPDTTPVRTNRPRADRRRRRHALRAAPIVLPMSFHPLGDRQGRKDRHESSPAGARSLILPVGKWQPQDGEFLWTALPDPETRPDIRTAAVLRKPGLRE